MQHTWRWYCCRAEVESVPLCTLSDCVCCGVCTTHDFRASYRPLRRDVAVLHIHARMGTNRHHSGQRCWAQRKMGSRHDLRRAGPVVTVCAVVCVRLMTGVPHAGRSAELWRFCTSTRVWERADSTAANGAGPSTRSGHVMTSVGLDLWVHGGQTETGEGDGCGTHVALLLLS